MMNAIIRELGCRGYKAEKVEVMKNGITYLGVTIGDNDVRPTIYIDKYINEGFDVRQIVGKVLEIYNDNKYDIPDFDINYITEWEYAKENLRLCIQSQSTEDIVKRKFLDMEMYVRVDVGHGTYKVNLPTLQRFGTSENELFDIALKRMKDNIEVEDLVTKLASMMGDDANFLRDSQMPQQFILTNPDNMYGAAGICDIEILEEIANRYKSNLVILPSSIHECLI